MNEAQQAAAREDMIATIDDAVSRALTDVEIAKEHAQEAKAVAENERDSRDTEEVFPPEDVLKDVLNALDFAERALTNASNDLALIMTWGVTGKEDQPQ